MSGGSHDEMLRAARNQALHREVNERIRELNERFDEALAAGGTWVCECFDSACQEQMELTLGDYEQLRAHPNRFAVLPGHVEEKVERIVEQHESYVIVEKVGAAATYVVDHDPREPERAT